jgi:hypothetical protein
LPGAAASGTLAFARPRRSMSETSSPSGSRSGSRAERLGVRVLRALWVWPAVWLLRVLAASWRVEIRGGDPFAAGGPVLAATWHEGGLIAAGMYRDRGYHVLVSRSRDGGHIAAVLVRLGFGESSRGSSSRAGARALLGARRILAQGRVAGILVDGPRGPARVAKAGVISAARLAGVPVWPMVFAGRPCLRFASWDRMRLPLPFARVVVQHAEPLAVPRDATDAEIESLRARFEERLLALARALDAELDGPGTRSAPA